MEPIIQPIDPNLIKQELTPELRLRKTNRGHNELYVFTAEQAPNTMREVGRIREVCFRNGGGGTGKACDIDEFDTDPQGAYRQLIAWDPQSEKIMGGYRFILGEEVLAHPRRTDALATAHMFAYSPEFNRDYLPYTIELGRSFVTEEFQAGKEGSLSIYALDNLWDGLGALTLVHPQVRYFFGKVTMYKQYDRYCRNLILRFMELYFGDKQGLVTPKQPLPIELSQAESERIFAGNDLRRDYMTLKRMVLERGMKIPPLFNAYMSLSSDMVVFGTAINDEFGDVEETGILVDMYHILPDKRKRHIDSYVPEGNNTALQQ